MKKIINAFNNAISTVVMVIWLGICVTGYIVMTTVKFDE